MARIWATVFGLFNEPYLPPSSVTVTAQVAVTCGLLSDVTVIVAVPTLTAVTLPRFETVAT